MAENSSNLPSTNNRPRARGVWADLRRRPIFWLSAAVLAVFLVVTLLPGPIAGIFGHGDPRACDLARSGGGPEPGYPFGFDVQGCDIWANAIYGARASIMVGFLATAITLTIAMVMGTAAGLGGKVVDWIITRLNEIFLGFPLLIAAIIVLNMLGTRNVWTVSIVLGVFGWPMMARLVRTSVISVRNADYVVAARTMGLGRARVIFKYVLPNSLQPVLVLATISVGSVIVAESVLTYLGIGLSPPAISWGLQIAAGSRVFQTDPHILFLPSVLLALTVISIVALGEEMRAAVDPRERR